MFYIPRRYYEEVIAHLKSALPNEGCGLLAGSAGRIVKHYPATNAEHSPILYSIDSIDLLDCFRESEEHDWDLLAIYHSHTHSPAYPSPTDVERAFSHLPTKMPLFPGTVYLIVSLKDLDKPVMRGFHILDGAIQRERLRIGRARAPRH